MPRKSPIHHRVRPHERAGVHVHQYERGDGKPNKRRVIGAPRGGGAGFTVTVSYLDEGERFETRGAYPEAYGWRSDHFRVRAGDYLGALDTGLGMLGGGKVPVSVKMRRV